jgi:hypothetical protein
MKTLVTVTIEMMTALMVVCLLGLMGCWVSGCYDVEEGEDGDTEDGVDTEDSEGTDLDSDTIIHTDSDTGADDTDPVMCTYEGKGYSANSCMCSTKQTSTDHYACCEQFGSGWGWTWYVCPTGPMNTEASCAYDDNDVSISCVYQI